MMTKDLTQKVEEFLEEGTRLEITESRLPNTGEGKLFVEISQVGLNALKNIGREMGLALERIDFQNLYSSYAPEPEDYYG